MRDRVGDLHTRGLYTRDRVRCLRTALRTNVQHRQAFFIFAPGPMIRVEVVSIRRNLIERQCLFLSLFMPSPLPEGGFDELDGTSLLCHRVPNFFLKSIDTQKKLALTLGSSFAHPFAHPLTHPSHTPSHTPLPPSRKRQKVLQKRLILFLLKSPRRSEKQGVFSNCQAPARSSFRFGRRLSGGTL